MGSVTVLKPQMSNYVSLDWGFSPYGNSPSSYGDGYYDSVSDCCALSCPGWIMFGNSKNSYKNNTNHEVVYHLDVDGALDSYNNDIEVVGPWLINDYCNCTEGVIFNYNFITSINTNIRNFLNYGGHRFWVGFMPVNARHPYVFRFEPGNFLEDETILSNKYGAVYYCGVNTYLTSGGIPLFTPYNEHGNYLDVEILNDIAHMLEAQHMQSPDPYMTVCGGNLPLLESTRLVLFFTPPSDDGGSDDGDDDCVCDSCFVDILDCCNDDIFTSDLNEFSSLKSPDTYIDEGSGEESRDDYNGCLHIARAIEISAKVFYALVWRIWCEYKCLKSKESSTSELSDINDTLKELLEEFKSKWFGYEVIVESKHSAYGGKASLNYRAYEDDDFLDVYSD